MARVASVTGGLALGLLLFLAWQSFPASAQSEVQIGIEVVSGGSSATNVNSADACTPVSSGDSVDVNIYIRDVTDLIAWEAYLKFDEDRLAFVSADPKLFLQNEPGSKLLTLSEPLSKGRHFIGAADSSAAAESGSGVLARITLVATAAGIARVDLLTADVNGDGRLDIGPRLTSIGGGHPGDTNGDGVFDGPLVPAFIAIDTSCSGVPTPGPNEGSDTDVLPVAATPAPGGNGSGSDDGEGSSGGSGGGSDGDVSDGPTSGDSDTESDGSNDGGSSDGGSSDGDGSGGGALKMPPD